MKRRYAITAAGAMRTVELEEADERGAIRVLVDGRERLLDVRPAPGGLTWIDGTRVVSVSVEGEPPKLSVAVGGVSLAVEVADARAVAAQVVLRDRLGTPGRVSVRAPMPGRAVKILVQPGERVKAGKALLVIEAMKMENEIRAPRDGVVAQIGCVEGAAVEGGQELVILE